MNWKNFWQDYPVRTEDLDLFQQVGKTINGVAIAPQQFAELLNDILKNLKLKETEYLLDLCCGNGLITKCLSQHVHKASGVDYSAPLIESANKNNAADNIEYLLSDIKNILYYENSFEHKFDKVLCYEALAFFNEDELHKLLDDLKNLISPDATILIASVLDQSCKFNFYNTFTRKLMYLLNRIKGTDPGLGKWWNMNNIKKIAEASGYNCKIVNQNNILHTAHYRKDIVLYLKNG